jgi:hypothetical protein
MIIAKKVEQLRHAKLEVTAVEPKQSTKEHREATVWGVHLSEAHNLTKEEREELLFKLNRLFTFVGTEIPEEIELDGQVVALHEVMWRLINHDKELTPEEFAAVQRLYVVIERKIHEIESTIRSQDIDEHEALALYAEAQGLIRAAVELRDFEKGKLLNNYVKTASTNRNEAQKRWLSYLRKIK